MCSQIINFLRVSWRIRWSWQYYQYFIINCVIPRAGFWLFKELAKWASNSEKLSVLWQTYSPGGEYFCQNCMWICLPDLENFTFSILSFSTITHPSVYLFQKEKHPILLKLGAFYHNVLKIHPIYVIWAPPSLMKAHRSLYQISRISTPKGRQTCQGAFI